MFKVTALRQISSDTCLLVQYLIRLQSPKRSTAHSSHSTEFWNVNKTWCGSTVRWHRSDAKDVTETTLKKFDNNKEIHASKTRTKWRNEWLRL